MEDEEWEDLIRNAKEFDKQSTRKRAAVPVVVSEEEQFRKKLAADIPKGNIGRLLLEKAGFTGESIGKTNAKLQKPIEVVKVSLFIYLFVKRVISSCCFVEATCCWLGC
jgi:hypothetical protein